MTADDARKLTARKQLPRSEVVKSLLETYYRAIKTEAERGGLFVYWSSISPLRTNVQLSEKLAAQTQLREDGYAILDDRISWG